MTRPTEYGRRKRDQVSANSPGRLHGNSSKQGTGAEQRCVAYTVTVSTKAALQKYAEEKGEEGRKEGERVSNNAKSIKNGCPRDCD